MRKNQLKNTISYIIALVLLSGCSISMAMPSYDTKIDRKGYLSVYKHSYYYDLQMGTQLADQGQFAKAVPYLKRATFKNPTNVIAQYNLGYCLLQAAQENPSKPAQEKQLAEAEWAFMRTRDLNPELSMTYYKLGKLALMRDDYESAKDYYETGVEANPENVGLIFNLAAAYEKLNDLDHAEKAYLQAIKANPRFVYAHNNLGLLYEQQNKLEEAEAVYRNALEEIPEYNYARLNLGSLLQSQGRLDEAEQVYHEAINYEPDNAWAFLYLGNTHYRKGDYEHALECYEKAISLKPDYPTTYYLASLALQKLNRNQEALANGMHYINMAPNGAFSQEAGEMIMTLQNTK